MASFDFDFDSDQPTSNLNSVLLPPSPLLLPSSPPSQSIRLGSFEVDPSFGRIRNRYKSAFTEIGLDGAADTSNGSMRDDTPTRPGPRVRWRSQLEIHGVEQGEDRAIKTERPGLRTPWNQYASPATVLSRLSFLAVILVIMIPVLHMSPQWSPGPVLMGAEAGPIDSTFSKRHELESSRLLPRQSNAADVCLRWSHQSALVNGTLYLYGGRSKKDSHQASNTWNNNLVKLDLATSWQISSPTMENLAQPSGPPPVANGFLWNSPDTLYLYGGQFSDKPETSPVPYSLWSYNIPSSEWRESENPRTVDNVPVERSSEGSGVNIPSLGRGMYFGGHVDRFTTPGWDINVFRVYLRSLLEFTFPGSANADLNDNKPAGPDGTWRNITEGGIQEEAGFTERADGVLVYVPGYSDQGILLGLAGGTNTTYTQMNVIDVYDIAAKTWYKQATSGPTPDYRVNPCAVATSAADGTSIQVHLFGGQKLLPYGSQEQYNDLWILTIPSFTWIEVDQTNQAVPPGRSGHTCNVWNAQMIIVGGYVGPDLSCDSPGIYIFNTSSLTWSTSYAALLGANPLNQQLSQESNPAALPGSYSYLVPDAVQKVIGGNAFGSATITAPAQTVTAGPFATGLPVTYTVTRSDGSIATETATPGNGKNNNDGNNSNRGPNTAAIVAGVIAGLFALLAAYLGFCTWVYRRQLALYKRHVAMSQRQALGIAPPPILGVVAGNQTGGEKSSLDATTTTTGSGASSGRSQQQGGRSGGGGGGVYQPVPTTMGNTFAGGLDRRSESSGYGAGAGVAGLATARSSTEDLLEGQEPTFLGVLLSPRRSLKVINRD